MIEQITPGFILVNKPAGITSFGCVYAFKKLLPRKTKVGHTGTLDDFASGLLIICIGREATRLSSALMGYDKEYVVKAKLGELSDSLDLTSKNIQTMPIDRQITTDMLKEAMTSLCPSYIQTPPIYSALKHEGKPLYNLARVKKLDTEVLEKIVQQKGREIFIKDIELVSFEAPFFTFRARVSKGTYVRSLAHDIAQKLGTCATTYELERTSINVFTLGEAVKLSQIQAETSLDNYIISVEKMLEMVEKE